MTALTYIRNNGALFVDRHDILQRIHDLSKMETSISGKELVTGANTIAHQLSRGYWCDIGEGSAAIQSMLRQGSPEFPSMHSVYIARALRAVTGIDEGQGADILRSLVMEASRPNRITSYSSMDISEMVHSIQKLLRMNGHSTDAQGELVSLFNALLKEFVERRLYVKIELKKRSRAHSQSLTIQGLSNIAYSVSRVKATFPVADRVLCDLFPILLDLLINHTQPESIEACQIMHLVSLMESLLSLCGTHAVTEEEYRCFKLLLQEFVRKRRILPKDKHHACCMGILVKLESRWTDPKARNFIFRVRTSLTCNS